VPNYRRAPQLSSIIVLTKKEALQTRGFLRLRRINELSNPANHYLATTNHYIRAGQRLALGRRDGRGRQLLGELYSAADGFHQDTGGIHERAVERGETEEGRGPGCRGLKRT